ncbi:Hint domain-containing protein [Maribius pontilimi]|uniref:Hint domain-containing protein n=1 Tax=Palleronia pontilimi TaxID=1964209 RepID=A0A934IK88_9RHOB|nr:Hint domain-containing protein [Palleronia pontilimi]MBJ3764501.1 Hint domain-containing protein [Palleronia pontilimi]
MPGYISELSYDGPNDFIEVVVSGGTDMSSYAIYYYDISTGATTGTMSFTASPEATIAGKDVYLFDPTHPDWAGLDAGLAYALVDDTGTVLQFVSVDGKTTTATDGPANGQTSTNIGTVTDGSSLETSDRGASYAVQPAANPGTIPCFATGNLIDTPDGPHPVEDLAIGDLVMTVDAGPQPVRWINRRFQSLVDAADDARPVLFARGALGPGRPTRDLLVSPQHRILVGTGGQLEKLFDHAQLVPAKALTGLPGIRHMRGRKTIIWVHFLCDAHHVVTSNGCLSESLLPGPQVVAGLRGSSRTLLSQILQSAGTGDGRNVEPALPLLSVQAARKRVASAKIPARGQTPA